MTTTQDQLFVGLTRKRLPGMHMITAIEGGVPLRDALAAFLFMTLHDKLAHDCLIQETQAEIEESRQAAIQASANPEGMFFGGLGAIMADSGLRFQEWSYLSDQDALIFYIMADAASEQTQRWICEGVEEPYKIPLGDLVERPAWSKPYYAIERSGRTQEAREYVARLRTEIPDS